MSGLSIPLELHCHEIWHYDDKKHVQSLLDLLAICYLCYLCYLCHRAKHIGQAGNILNWQ